MDGRIGVIVAMDIELGKIREAMKVEKIEEISGIPFYLGHIGERSVVAARCGIGKVFAALCAQTMILRYQPEVLVGAGVAGALAELPIGGAAIGEDLVEHDMDTTPIGDPLGFISGLNMVHMPCSPKAVKLMEEIAEELKLSWIKGTIASGDAFVSSSAKKEQLMRDFGAIACEMEGAAIAQVCCTNKQPFVVIRCISDNGDENSGSDYAVNAAKAADASAALVLGFIRRWS